MNNEELSDKFKHIVKKLNYSQIFIDPLNIKNIETWSRYNLSFEVNQLELLGWDLFDANTWKELVFSNCLLSWYKKRINFFITGSEYELNLAYKTLNYPIFSKFRNYFNIDSHVCLLLDPIILIEEEDLDIIYNNINDDENVIKMSLSHYDENESIQEKYREEWGWLDEEVKKKKNKK